MIAELRKALATVGWVALCVGVTLLMGMALAVCVMVVLNMPVGEQLGLALVQLGVLVAITGMVIITIDEEITEGV